MSPALNGSSAIWHFKSSNVIEIHDGITFDFYTGLPQSLNKRVFCSLVKYAVAKLHNLLIECCNTILAIAKVVMGTILADSCNHGQIAMAIYKHLSHTGVVFLNDVYDLSEGEVDLVGVFALVVSEDTILLQVLHLIWVADDGI